MTREAVLACTPSLWDEINKARREGRQPRVHPNGFLQLDLDPDPSLPQRKRRLHIFDDSLPRQVVRTSIHDHVFKMDSFCMKGTVINDVYRAVPDPEGEYEVHQAHATKGTETTLQGTGQRMRVEIERSSYVRMGMSYTFPAFEFHNSRHEGTTATLMTKLAVEPGEPRVLVPVGAEPDNSFSREEQDIDALWALIEETFPHA
jgi:hypothetical protein